MRSVKYHCAYWAIALTTAITYNTLALTLGVPEVVFQVLLIPHLAFLISLVLQGPCAEPRSRLYYVALGILLISLGSLSKYFSIPTVEMEGPNRFVHSCLAFQVLGSLEAIRQNRHDIEPSSVGLIMEAPSRNLASDTAKHRTRHFAYRVWRMTLGRLVVWYSYLVVFIAVAVILDFFVKAYGPGISCLSIFSHNTTKWSEHLGSSALLFYIGAALADTAETIFLLILEYFNPSWPKVVQGQTPLLDPVWGWSLFSSEIMQTSALVVAMLVYVSLRTSREGFGRTP